MFRIAQRAKGFKHSSTQELRTDNKESGLARSGRHIAWGGDSGELPHALQWVCCNCSRMELGRA